MGAHLKTASIFQDFYWSDYWHLNYVDPSIRSVTMTALLQGCVFFHANPFMIRVLLASVIWIFDTFENIFEIKQCLAKC